MTDPTTSRRFAVGLLFCCFPSVVLARGDLIRVSPSAAADFQDLQAAIDASSPGDVIVVASGTYAGPISLPSHDLTIAGMVGHDPTIVDGVELPGGGSQPAPFLELRDFRILGLDAVYPNQEAGSAVNGNGFGGALRLVDCHLQGGGGYKGDCAQGEFGERSGSGISFAGSPASYLSLRGCVVRGGESSTAGSFVPEGIGAPGGRGVSFFGGGFSAVDCDIRGGDGEPGEAEGGDGGDALKLWASPGFLEDCVLVGGAGGDEGLNPWLCSGAGNGGHGLSTTTTETVFLHATTPVGGQGGGSTYNLPGAPGAPIFGPATVVTLSGPKRSLDGPAWSAAGDPVTLSVAGGAQELVWLGRGTRAAVTWRPLQRDPWRVAFPVRFEATSLGSLSAGGAGSFVGVAPSPPLGEAAALWLLEAALLPGQGPAEVTSVLDVVSFDPTAGPDCNQNGILDLLDLLAGTSTDHDLDLVPDECAGTDCNRNGIDDAIDLAAGTSVDLDGNGMPDECQPPRTLHIDPTAGPGGDGSTTAPFDRIRPALLAAIGGDTLALHAGVYASGDDRDLTAVPANLTLLSVDGPHAAIVDCGGQGRFLEVLPGLAGEVVLDGICVRNGAAASGGGVRVSGARLVVRRCSFEHCSADAGGAIDASSSELIVVATRFLENTASTGGGGALRVAPSAPDELVRVSECEFLANEAHLFGGALFVDAGLTSGAMTLHVSGCTFVANRAIVGAGGSLAVTPGSNGVLANSVFWGGIAPAGAELALVDPGLGGVPPSLHVRYSDVAGGPGAVADPVAGLTWGPGNLSVYPSFQDPDGADDTIGTWADNDFRLSSSSPCLDAGEAASIALDDADLDGDGNYAERVPFDLDGGPRRVDDPAPDSGAGPPPVVDLGAYER